MAQHLNQNQIHQINQIPMLQGINLTILNNQQHLNQFASQPGHQNMYQIVQQSPGGQLQMQNVVQQQQHQFSSLQHMQQQQHLQAHQQQHILVPQQHAATFTPQQLQHLQINQQQMIQQQAQQQQQQLQQQQNQQQAHQQQQQQQQQAHQQQLIQQQQTNGKGKGKKKGPKVNKEGVPAPKRATTAYINFTQWYREEIKKTGRSVPKVGEFGKECAGKWNSMTEEEKKPFTQVANKDRERYKKEMEIYKPSRDVNKPKRPGTAFMLFMVDFRKEVAGKEPEGGVAALAKLGGERWRNMTDEEKKPYCDKQNECKMAYEIAMEEYRKASGQIPLHAVKAEGQSAELNSIGDSDTSEQLNNSLSNLSNNHTLDTTEQVINSHNSQSPASNSTSPSGQSMSPNLQQQQAQQQAAAAAAAAQQQLQEQQQSQQQANGNALDQLASNFYTESSYNAAAAAFHADSDLDRQLEQQLDQVNHDATADALFQAATQQPPYQTQSHYSWN